MIASSECNDLSSRLNRNESAVTANALIFCWTTAARAASRSRSVAVRSTRIRRSRARAAPCTSLDWLSAFVLRSSNHKLAMSLCGSLASVRRTARLRDRSAMPPIAAQLIVAANRRDVHKETYAVQQITAYSITSSARPSSVSGKVMPNDLAVFMLMISSILEARSTGRSPGFSPLRILPV
jgi:hypothetical protein